eukprot:8987370-Ditylum_brightwellii.AAC.1
MAQPIMVDVAALVVQPHLGVTDTVKVVVPKNVDPVFLAPASMGGIVEGQTEASAQCNLEVWWGEAVLQYGAWCGEDCVSCCCLEEGGQGFLKIARLDVVDVGTVFLWGGESDLGCV